MVRPEIKVAAAALTKDGLLLLTRRKSGKFAGKWELPGGKLEPDETAETACRREIAEELELELSELRFLFNFNYSYPDFELQMSVFGANLPAQSRPALRVHDSYAFVSASELEHFDWIEADLGMIPLLQKALVNK